MKTVVKIYRLVEICPNHFRRWQEPCFTLILPEVLGMDEAVVKAIDRYSEDFLAGVNYQYEVQLKA